MHEVHALFEFEEIPEPDTPANRKLVAAVKVADADGVREAIQEGAGRDLIVRYVPSDGNPDHEHRRGLAFLTLYEPVSLEIFRLLIHQATDLNAVDEETGIGLLQAAVLHDDLDTVRSLLSRGARPGATATFGAGADPVLFYVAATGMGESWKTIEFAATLLDFGADPNAPASNGLTPLMIAARTRKREMVKLLLRRGAHPSIRSSENQTALHYARKGGDSEIEALLVGQTELEIHDAVRLGQHEFVKAWLSKDPDLTVRDAKGATLLHVAVQGRNLEAVRRLLEAGIAVDEPDAKGLSALFLAAERGDPETMRVLLDAGASPDMDRGQAEGEVFTPLFAAIFQWEAEAVELLLESGVNLHRFGQAERAFRWVLERLPAGEHNSNLRGRARRRTPDEIKEAKMRVLARVLKFPVDAQADRSRAVFLAARMGAVGLIDHLLKRGASADGRDADGWMPTAGMTALSGALFAWAEGRTLMKVTGLAGSEAFFFLLERGAQVDIPDNRGHTPLTFAVMIGIVEAVEALLQRGARPDEKTWTAISEDTPPAILERLRPYEKPH